MKSSDSPLASVVDNDAHWDLVLEPHSSLFSLQLGEVWRYRDLLYLFTRRDIVSFYKQTILGPIWFFIQPIFTTLVYVLVSIPTSVTLRNPDPACRNSPVQYKIVLESKQPASKDTHIRSGLLSRGSIRGSVSPKWTKSARAAR